MKSKINKETDQKLREAVRSVTPAKPSVDFVFSVMSKIEQLPAVSRVVTKNEPLISWRGWFFITIFVVGLLAFGLTTTSTGYVFELPTLDLVGTLSGYFSIFVSRFFVVGMAVLAILFIFQILLFSWSKERALR
ncbi:MAG: hypothetical protein WAT79_10060 [Saprospiraceae bacterium]